MKVVEDGVWRYFNCPDALWSDKCRRCRQRVAEERVPVEECLNCWKVEVWSLGPAMRWFRAACGGGLSTFSEEQCFLVDEMLKRGNHVVAKASRAPILVVRTGIPRDGYPPEETDYLLMLYACGIEERDRLKREAEAVLGSAGLPIRRGCWRYDDLLGPWETWYPPEKDAGPVDAGPACTPAHKT